MLHAREVHVHWRLLVQVERVRYVRRKAEQLRDEGSAQCEIPAPASLRFEARVDRPDVRAIADERRLGPGRASDRNRPIVRAVSREIRRRHRRSNTEKLPHRIGQTAVRNHRRDEPRSKIVSNSPMPPLRCPTERRPGIPVVPLLPMPHKLARGLTTASRGA